MVRQWLRDGRRDSGIESATLTLALPKSIVGLGLIALAALMAFGRRKTLALVPTLTVAGLLTFSVGGGFLIAATWAVLGALVATGRTETVATT